MPLLSSYIDLTSPETMKEILFGIKEGSINLSPELKVSKIRFSFIFENN